VGGSNCWFVSTLFYGLLYTNSLTVFPLKVNDIRVGESDSFRRVISVEKGT